jgi:hypothetical protein
MKKKAKVYAKAHFVGTLADHARTLHAAGDRHITVEELAEAYLGGVKVSPPGLEDVIASNLAEITEALNKGVGYLNKTSTRLPSLTVNEDFDPDDVIDTDVKALMFIPAPKPAAGIFIALPDMSDDVDRERCRRMLRAAQFRRELVHAGIEAVMEPVFRAAIDSGAMTKSDIADIFAGSDGTARKRLEGYLRKTPVQEALDSGKDRGHFLGNNGAPTP